jgi:hypothetical protein
VIRKHPFRNKDSKVSKTGAFYFGGQKMPGMKNARIIKVFSFSADKRRGNDSAFCPFTGSCPLGGGSP